MNCMHVTRVRIASTRRARLGAAACILVSSAGCLGTGVKSPAPSAGSLSFNQSSVVQPEESGAIHHAKAGNLGGVNSATLPSTSQAGKLGNVQPAAYPSPVVQEAMDPELTAASNLRPFAFSAAVTSKQAGAENQLPAVAGRPAGDGTALNAPPRADGTGLSVEAIESLALRNHPALREFRARVQSSAGQYVQAGLPFNPVLQYQSEEMGSDGHSGIHMLQMNQQIVTANKLGLAQSVQQQQVARRRAEQRQAELRVLTRVRTAFIRTLVAQQRLELSEGIAELSSKSVASVQALFDAQQVSKISLLQARIEAQQARISADNAATQLDASRRALAAAIGIPQLPPESLVGDISAGLNEQPWEERLAGLLQSSPEMEAAGAELLRAKQALLLACAQVTPNVTGQIGVGVDAASDDAIAMVGLSVPLPIRNRNEGNIRSARADIAAAGAAIERTQLDLESRLANAVGSYATALRRYRRLQDEVLPDAEETYALSARAFEAGETNFLQLLTAQRTLFTIRLESLDAILQARESEAAIRGMLVDLGA